MKVQNGFLRKKQGAGRGALVVIVLMTVLLLSAILIRSRDKEAHVASIPLEAFNAKAVNQMKAAQSFADAELKRVKGIGDKLCDFSARANVVDLMSDEPYLCGRRADHNGETLDGFENFFKGVQLQAIAERDRIRMWVVTSRVDVTSKDVAGFYAALDNVTNAVSMMRAVIAEGRAIRRLYIDNATKWHLAGEEVVIDDRAFLTLINCHISRCAKVQKDLKAKIAHETDFAAE